MKKMWISLIAIALLAGCIGDEFDTDLIVDDVELTTGTGLLLPIAHTSVTMGDILSDETDMIKYNGEEILFFIENAKSDSVGLNDFFQISDASLADLPFNFAIFKTKPTYKVSSQISFNIKKASISSTKADYTIRASANNLYDAVIMELKFPSINDGKVINFELSNDNSFSENYLNEVLTLTDGKLPVEMSIRPKNTMAIYPDYWGSISISIGDFNLRYIKGTMEENTVTLSEESYELDFDVLKDIPGDIEFSEPNIKLFFDNRTPFKGEVDLSLSGETEDNEIVNLGTPSIELPAFDETNNTHAFAYNMSEKGFNVAEFIAKTPSNLKYSGELVLNPGGVVDEVELYEKDKIYVGYGVEAPLDLKLNAIMDEEVIELDDIDFIEDIVNARLVFTSENGFPLGAKATLKFFDKESNSILETIVADIILPAEVDDSGIVSKKASNTEVIDLTEQQIKNLNESEEIRLSIELQTSDYDNNKSVVFQKSNELTIKLGIKGKIESN